MVVMNSAARSAGGQHAVQVLRYGTWRTLQTCPSEADAQAYAAWIASADVGCYRKGREPKYRIVPVDAADGEPKASAPDQLAKAGPR